MNRKRLVQVVLSLMLPAAMLWWLYRDFPFATVSGTLRNDVRWDWMLFSLLFGILPQIIRGLRWRSTLEPLGERPSMRNCVYSVFLSFGASLVIPRIGEISRCTVLNRTDGTPFAKSLGTVVTERVVDSLLILVVLAATFIIEMPLFLTFCADIGLDRERFFAAFTPTGLCVAGVCLMATVVIIRIVLRRFHLSARFKQAVRGFGEGIASLRHVRSLPLYAVETVAIWVCYFLHFYLAFFAFPFTAELSVEAGMLAFCLITVAVLVPTPNGVGPWHWAVKVVLMLFGIREADAILFALIVHALQTLLVVLLAVWAALALRKTTAKDNRQTTTTTTTNTTTNS